MLYGIRTIATLLSTGKLKVTDRCKTFMTEVAGYSWDTQATSEGYDQPIKSADHALDAARYAIVTTEKRWRRYVDVNGGEYAAS